MLLDITLLLLRALNSATWVAGNTVNEVIDFGAEAGGPIGG